MAHCVISAVMDTDDPMMPIKPGCVVHTTWAPCDRNGEPAVTTPLHCADGDPDRESAIEHWRRKTHGQRPTWLHHGSLAEDHDINDEGACWCSPERFGDTA